MSFVDLYGTEPFYEYEIEAQGPNGVTHTLPSPASILRQRLRTLRDNKVKILAVRRRKITIVVGEWEPTRVRLDA